MWSLSDDRSAELSAVQFVALLLVKVLGRSMSIRWMVPVKGNSC